MIRQSPDQFPIQALGNGAALVGNRTAEAFAVECVELSR